MISHVHGVLDISSLEFQGQASPLTANSISKIQLKTTKALVMDPYTQNRVTGSFILVDEGTGATVAAGMLS
jgi:sulfate adenylyltransferase subunit 1 (EFTu-like GTPase family)